MPAFLGLLSGLALTLFGDTYDGRANAIKVAIPRVDADVAIDGQLTEAAWQRAAVLRGFSQFSPQDGIPAADSTQVLVWYSATAIHFGIRAFEAHGKVNATLADRDRIGSDDNVQILLGTFNDGRQATVFGVNPLGVQLDGTLVESNTVRGGGFMQQASARESADLSQDFVFASKGRVTDWGYEVELRIPFKSLRYQSIDRQVWSLNVVRVVQHSGVEDTWAPARRANASFLAQSGTLEGLTDLRRGLVLDLNPVATQRTVGAQQTPASPGAGWRYDAERAEVGLNARWGISNNSVLNATINPDFSQVESDAGQFSFDPRSAIFFPEKRPFFLDGMEGFATPFNLVYTRRIQIPVAAAKLTGKRGAATYAVLSAVDDRSTSLTFNPATREGGSRPVYNIARVQRDLGVQSRIGATYTDKMDGDYSNRVADLDGRLVFARVYSVAFQGAVSRTNNGDSAVMAPLWSFSFNRSGKRFSARYAMSGMDARFNAGSGFISRPGLSNMAVDHRFTWFGAPTAFLRSAAFNPVGMLTWKYARLMHGGDAIEKKLHFNTQYELRGGWTAGASSLIETFGYDPDLYRGIYVRQPTANDPNAAVPFTGTPRLYNLDWVLSAATPRWQRFSMNAMYLWGQDENFDEWATSDITFANVSALVRPTEKLRISPSFLYQSYNRPATGEQMRTERIARVRTEYQITRPLYVRLVGEYRSFDRVALRDESRTGQPLMTRRADGTFAPIPALRRHTMRPEWLVSYQPSPGTVFFTGYGSTYLRSWQPAAEEFGPGDLLATRYRANDAFFVKASYLFRM
jgi:hypothetical protein